MCSKNMEEWEMHSKKKNWMSGSLKFHLRKPVESEGQKKARQGLGQMVQEWNLGCSFCWKKKRISES